MVFIYKCLCISYKVVNRLCVCVYVCNQCTNILIFEKKKRKKKILVDTLFNKEDDNLVLLVCTNDC